MKKCTKCLDTKKESEFNKRATTQDGLAYHCQQCNKIAVNKWRKLNHKEVLAKKCIFREANKEYCSNLKKQHYNKNKVRLLAEKVIYRAVNKEAIRKTQKLWYKNNRTRYNNYLSNRYATDIQFRLASLLRTRLGQAINLNSKTGSAVKDLGCTITELKLHLESKFSEGMTWQNQGKWHIDHIKPLSKFNLENRNEFIQACHYTNLQPLWAIDNIKKGNKYE